MKETGLLKLSIMFLRKAEEARFSVSGSQMPFEGTPEELLCKIESLACKGDYPGVLKRACAKEEFGHQVGEAGSTCYGWQSHRQGWCKCIKHTQDDIILC